MIDVSKPNLPSLSLITYKAHQTAAHETKAINQSKTHRMAFNYSDKPSIMRAQLTPKPPNRDASFSSYLKPNDALQPAHRAQDSEISIFEAEKYFNGIQTTNGVYKPPDIPTTGRLSLSTPKQSVSSISRLSSVSDDSYGRNYRARSFHATPTASSEASWNSQTGLLTNPPGLAPVSIRNLPNGAERSCSKKPGAPRNWLLRGNICPCSGKKSVNIKESPESDSGKLPPTPPRIVQLNQLNRISSSGGSSGYLYPSRQSSPMSARTALIQDQSARNLIARPQLDPSKFINPNLDGFRRDQSLSGAAGNGFTFPILNGKAAPPNRAPVVVVADGGASGAETPRDSIEVFQPREGASPKSRRASYDDDICSDASSDLFEIESFSTIRRDSLDDPASSFNVRRLQIAAFNKVAASSIAITGLADDEVDEPVTPSIAPTECYPPSEVSVDWSVTTAEGFDRASLAGFSVSASESGYAALRQPTKGSFGADESKKKATGGLLMSCRCEKAVNVAEIRHPVPTTRGQLSGRAQAHTHVNGGSTTDNNGAMRSTRSTLMPLPFAAEGHRHSL